MASAQFVPLLLQSTCSFPPSACHFNTIDGLVESSNADYMCMPFFFIPWL